jgi:hypothetical protein
MEDVMKEKKQKKQKENRPLTDRPFAFFFKRTKKGRAWLRENLNGLPDLEK